MMFSKSPLDKACANRDRLLADVGKDEKRVLAKGEAVDSAYDDADASEDARTKVRAAKHDADEALKASKAALARAETLIVKIKQDEAAADLKARQQASATKILQDHVPRLAKGIKMYVEGAAMVAEVTTEMLPYTPDARRLQLITGNAALETPEHAELLITVAKSVAQSIIAGGPPLAEHAPPPMLLRPGAKQPSLPQPAETVAIFAIQPVRWKNAEGELQTSHRWSDIDVPPATAKKAIAMGAAVGMDHALRRQHHEDNSMAFGLGHGKNPVIPPPPETCLDIGPDSAVDAAPADTAHQPQSELHTAFQRVDRGPKVDFKVPRNEDIPATATRDLPKGDK
jgi:hypothetical protein